MLTVLLLLAGAPLQTAPTVYIPTAGMRVVMPANLTPVLRTADEVKDDQERYGTLLRDRWSLENRYGLFHVSHWRYPSGTAPKRTVRQIAEELYETSRDLAEQLDRTGTDKEFMARHLKKFTNRTVTERKVGFYTGFLDSHEDTLTKSHRRYLAWGDEKKQWQVELVARGEPARIDRLLDLILQSVAVGPVSAEEAKAAPLLAQTVPTLEATISAPGVFDVMTRPAASTSRPGVSGLSATMSLRDDYVVHIAQDKYADDKVSDTQSQASRLLRAMDMPGYEVKASKIVPIELGPLKGHVLRMDYVQDDAPMYGISACFARPGYELVVHINIAKGLGGRAKADEILATLKGS